MSWNELKFYDRFFIILSCMLLGLSFFFSQQVIATSILLPQFGLLIFFMFSYGWRSVVLFSATYFLVTLGFESYGSFEWFQSCVLFAQGICFACFEGIFKEQKYLVRQYGYFLTIIVMSLILGFVISGFLTDFALAKLYRFFLEIFITQCFFQVVLISDIPKLSSGYIAAALGFVLVIFLTLLHVNWQGVAFLAVFLGNYFYGGMLTSLVYIMCYTFIANYGLDISNDYLEILACIAFFTVMINLLRKSASEETYPINITWLTDKTEGLIKEIEEYKQLANIINYSATVAFLWRADDGRTVEYVSDNAWRIGYSPHSFKEGRAPFNRAIFSDDRARVRAKLEEVLAKSQAHAFELEYRLMTESGQIIWVVERSLIKRDAGDNVTHIQGTVMDITMNKEAEKRLHRLTYFDELTGLRNRVALIHALQEYIDKSHPGDECAVLLVDIDKFKHINDSFGHQCGDEIICGLAKRLDQLSESESLFVARLANDDFVFLVKDYVSIDDVEILADKILKVVSEPFPIHDRYYPLTARIGISLFPLDGRDVNALISNADVATSQAKEYGKNHFMFYNKSMRMRSMQDMRLASDLTLALNESQFVLFYQPKINLNTNEPSGAEVLLRWQHPERGLISPNEFVSLAEETGLIIALGAWVLETACHQLRAWHHDGLSDFRLSINLSPRQFWDASLLSLVERLIDETGINPDALELELTESMVMLDPEQYRIVMKKLRDKGIRISVDDFGVGHSSLNQIKRFPINTIKIDKSFVTDMLHDEDGRTIIKAIIALGHSLNLTIVAEGIENQAQADFLKSQGCDEAQGYFYSAPLQADAFRAWLKTYKKGD